MNDTVSSADRAGAADAPARSLTDRAYRQLEELIVTLDLAPGSVLSEASLAKRLNIGRTPIREALQRLAQEGLVVILPRRGVLVAEINVERQLKVIEFRRELERFMARAACHRASDPECRALAEIAEGMDAAASDNDDISFMRLDRQLNQYLAQAAYNEFGSKAIGLTQGLSRRFWYLHYKQVDDLPRCARLHAEQARAIAERQPGRAVEATEQLMDYVEEFTRATLDHGRLQ